MTNEHLGVQIFMSTLGVLLSVAYFTLLERKALAAFAIRKGPEKVGFLGIPQPFSDGMKLFTKEYVLPSQSFSSVFYFMPPVALLMMYVGWQLFPSHLFIRASDPDLLFFILFSAVNAHVVMLAGWSSNNKYASFGAVRGFAQVVSYEVSMGLILFSLFAVSGTLSVKTTSEVGWCMWTWNFCVFVLIMWMVTALAETNRAPFDLVEAESELVSGYSVEYSGGGFASLFIAEYGNVLLVSLFTVYKFFYHSEPLRIPLAFLVVFKVGVIAYWFIWVRASVPRYRYDQLMELCWTVFLPGILGFYLLFSLGLFYMGSETDLLYYFNLYVEYKLWLEANDIWLDMLFDFILWAKSPEGQELIQHIMWFAAVSPNFS